MRATPSLHRKSTARFLLITSASCAMLGCADRDEPASASDDTLSQAAWVALMSDAGPVVPYLNTVTANGTGCPKSTWHTDVARDGRTFTTTFSSYEAAVEDGQRVAFRDCNLTIKLHSDTPLSYAIDAFRYSGYAFMEENLRGFVTANYYFQGNSIPSASTDKRIDFIGPLDRRFLFEEAVPDADLVWSPCGRDRSVQVVTRAVLQKQQGKGTGYINLSNVGKYGSWVKYGLRWRPCAEDARDAGRAAMSDAGVVDAGAL